MTPHAVSSRSFLRRSMKLYRVLYVVAGIVSVAVDAAAATAAAATARANVLWPCSSSHRLPDSAAPVYFQLQAAAGCECVFTLEGPPGSILRVSLGERSSTQGHYGSAHQRPPFRPPPAGHSTDCYRGAVRAFALQSSGELNLRATVCGPWEGSQPFETETPVAVLTTTAPWGQLAVRVDVLYPPPQSNATSNATSEASEVTGTTPRQQAMGDTPLLASLAVPAELSDSANVNAEAVEAEPEEVFSSPATTVPSAKATSIHSATVSPVASTDVSGDSTDVSVNVV